MRDCDNLEVRERLPDLLHGTLADAARAEAEDHVASCADCAAELALLRSVRDGIAHAPGVDVDRIVAAIPPYRRSPRRDVRALSWRVAAALVFVAAGATLWSSAARSTRQPAVPSAAPLVTGATAAAPVAGLPAPAVAHHDDPQLSLGEPLNDLSEHDLRDLAAVVNQLDAMPSDDVDSPVSSFNEGES